MTRGLINHNPGNIRYGDDWAYLTEFQGDDDFCVFEHQVFGIRALAKTLLTYQRKHHLFTIEGIISRYAPPKDNNPTESYIDFVCQKTGFKRDESINLRVRSNMIPLIKAIIHMENGAMPYTEQDLTFGVVLAYET